MAANEQRPNQYRFEGEGVTVRYATSSFTGEAELEYRDGEYEVTGRGDAIDVGTTPIGSLATIELEGIPDLRSVTASLLVPEVNLGESNEVPCETVVIVTTSRTSFGGPGLVDGALQSYRSFNLQGTASLVEF